MQLWQRILLKSVAAPAANVATGKLWTWGSGTVGQLGLSGIFSIAHVTSGGSHQAALTSDGRIFTWGLNSAGQLGDGSTTNKSSPTQIGGQQSWLAVSAGASFTMAVRNDGGLFSWGDNQHGQLGLNISSLSRTYSPVQIGSSSWTAVSAGDSHAMAIRSDGSLFTWGLGASGQLGIGTDLDNRSSPTQIGSSSWTSVSAGGFHSLAILTGGTLYAWGLNTSGQLGTTNIAATGDVQGRSSPVQLGTSLWTLVSAGSSHTIAIKSGGTLWAWGNGTNGELGTGTATSRSSPVQIGAAATWSRIAAGINFSAGILTTGQMFTWGINTNGQLGNNTAVSRSSPTVVGTSSWTAISATRSGGTVAGATIAAGLWGWGLNTTGQVGDNTTVTKSVPTALTYTPLIQTYAPWLVSTSSWSLVSVGGSHTVGTLSVNTLFAWGLNNAGQLAQSNTINRSSPTVIGTSSWVALSASKTGSYTVAISAIRTLYAWGLNSSGQLGDATVVNKSAVTLIGFGASSWSVVSAGLNSTAAITLVGALYTWGNNAAGQLGDGTSVGKSSPTLVPGSWSTVSVGNSYTLAITNTGLLFAWGNNTSGQLGDSTTITRSIPFQIGTGSWSQVSAGTDHSLAIAANGSLWAWGNATSGQLGALIEPQSWAQIAEGNSFTIAKRTDGTIWSWGLNSSGQLGIRDTINRSSPTQIGVSSWSQVYASVSTAFAGAIKSDGTLWTWGVNNLGQLGDSTFINRSSPTQVAQVNTINSWINVEAGTDHTVGVAANGTLWGWGSNTGLTVRPGPFSWTQVSENGAHTLAIRDDGVMFAWGLNNVGQLGLGDTLNRSSPIQVGYQRWSQVSTGASHTLAVATDGSLWAWGLNTSYQLGVADIIARSNPTQVSGEVWLQISAGDFHSTGIVNKSLYAWGLGSAGQLGELTDTASWTTISAGANVAMLTNSASSLLTWGNGANGALGIGDTITRSSPVQVGTRSWAQVSASVDSMIAREANTNIAYVWGLNSSGQLGLGDTIARSSPVVVGGSVPKDVSSYSVYNKIIPVGNPGISTTIVPFPGTYSGVFNLDKNGVQNPTSGLDYIRVINGTNIGSLSPAVVYFTSVPGGFWLPYDTAGSPGLNPSSAAASLNDLTWEMWIYATSFVGPNAGCTILSYGNNSDDCMLRVVKQASEATATSTLQWYAVDAAGAAILGGSGLTGGVVYKNRWHHVAAVRRTGVYNLYLDGSIVATLTTASGIRMSSQTFTIGKGWVDASSDYFIGYISNVRLVAGLAVYTTNSFVPPTRPLLPTQPANFNGVPSTAITGRSTGFATYNENISISSGLSYTQVSAGGAFMMGIRPDSTLWGSGLNSVGQLGDNTTFNRSYPVQVGFGLGLAAAAAGSSWSQVRTGLSTTLAIRTDGGLFGWGGGTNGIIGNGSTANQSSPSQVGTSSWTQVALGPNSNHALGIKLDGTLWSWGLNSSMQLGDNTTISKSSPVLVGGVGGSGSWSAIAVGDNHSLGIKIDGTLWAWGLNNTYQLGVFNSTLARSSPTQIGTGSWSAVAAGVSYSMAKDTTGKVYVWGLNNVGQLGLTDSINRSSPTVLGNTLPPFYNSPNKVGTSDWVAVAAGASYTVGIGLDRKLYAWGLNTSYQLGDNTSVNKSTPVQIATSTSNWATIAADANHAGAINIDGQLFMWGTNAVGQLGTGDTLTRSSPTIVPGSTSWKLVSTGISHTAAIDSNNAIQTWGLDNVGQLGQAFTTGNQSTPTTISNDHTWTKITAGNSFTAAIDSTGALYTWGLNSSSQIGDNSTINKSSPVSIGNDVLSTVVNKPIRITTGSWSQVTAGNSISAAIKSDGSGWAWGNNTGGELGIGGYPYSPTYSPVAILGSISWSQISAGTNHMIGLDTAKKLWFWGSNDTGQLGDPNNGGTDTPAQNSDGYFGSLSWSSVAAGNSYTVATTIDGKLFAWGLNSSAQLGTGDTNNRNSPIQIASTGYNQTFSDRSTYNSAALTWTKVGNAQLVSFNPFSGTQYGDTSLYGGSLYLPYGTESWLEGPNPQTAGLRQIHQIGDFTLEGWVYLNATVPGYETAPILTIDDGNSPTMMVIGLGASSNSLNVDVGGVGTQAQGTNLNLRQWYHIALVRKDGIGYVYLDGTLDPPQFPWIYGNPFSYPTDIPLTGTTGNLYIGRFSGSGGQGSIPGFIHSVRFSHKAIYTGNFAKPTVPLGTSQPSGTNIEPLSPGEVALLMCCDLTPYPGNYAQVSASVSNAAAITNLGRIVMLGGPGGVGQLAEVTRTVNRSNMTQVGLVYPLTATSFPVAVNQSANWTAISAGNSYSMAIRGDGRLFAWGINANGILGTGDNITRSSPVQIGTNSWRTISAGISHTAGITSGGTNSVS